MISLPSGRPFEGLQGANESEPLNRGFSFGVWVFLFQNASKYGPAFLVAVYKPAHATFQRESNITMLHM